MLTFRPSAATVARAADLLKILKTDRLTAEEEQELTMFHQAELMLRFVKARVRELGQT